MPTFLDESGDPGRDPDPRNRHFHLAAVWVPTLDIAAEIRRAVKAARLELGLRSDYEFKFSKTWVHPDRRELFFGHVLRHEFRFAVATVDKHHPDRSDTEDIYWAAAVLLAATLRPTLLNSRGNSAGRGPAKELLILDDNGDRRFLKIVARAFRDVGKACDPPVSCIGKVKFRDSGPEELLQLADMVCGATVAHGNGSGEWYRRIEMRDVDHRPRRQTKPATGHRGVPAAG